MKFLNKHKDEYRNTLFEISNINRQFNETVYKYQIIHMAIFSYGKCRRYDYIDGSYMISKISFHILHDTYNTGYTLLIDSQHILSKHMDIRN